jgi:NADH:quinone reductase (non-electrogenic)
MSTPKVLVVGGGFGFHAARTLSRLLRGGVEITLLNPTD